MRDVELSQSKHGHRGDGFLARLRGMGCGASKGGAGLLAPGPATTKQRPSNSAAPATSGAAAAAAAAGGLGPPVEPWAALVGTEGVRGPTPTSHWLIKGRVLVGSCPGTHCYDRTTNKKRRCSRETVQTELSALQAAGVSQFFNFQQRMEEKQCKPYYVTQLERVWSGHGDTPGVNRFPIVDGGTFSGAELSTIMAAVEESLRAGHVIYLHCYGGHGRAGIVAAMTLHWVYGCTADEALAVVQLRHGAREQSMDGHRSPACDKQVEQVKNCCR